MQFHFGNHVLDVGRRELRRGSEPIAVEPQVFDLLLYLLQNRDRVASKDDLIASIWGGRIVSDSTLTSRIKSARNAVGDRFLSARQRPAIGGLLRSSIRHRAWAHPRGGAAAYGPKSRRLSNTSAPCAHNRTHPSPAYLRWIHHQYLRI